MSSLHRTIVPVGAALTLLFLLGQDAGAGVVTYLSQARNVHSRMHEEFPTPDGPPIDKNSDDSQDAPDFGPFSGDTSATVENGGTATASQQSTLLESGINASGSLDGFTHTSNGSYEAASSVDVTFRANAPLKYTLSFSVSADLLYDADPLAQVSFSRSGDPNPIFDFNERRLENSETSQTQSGTLASGDYQVHMLFAQSSEFSNHTDYSFSLGLVPTAPAIPLPPAIWSGGITMLGLALVWRRLIPVAFKTQGGG